MKIKFEMEDYGVKNTLEVNDEKMATIDEVMLEFVGFLQGARFGTELIKQYINYDEDNICINKIGE